jgi:protein-S-isoprenylcysteine O-methyltransferase Ste14
LPAPAAPGRWRAIADYLVQRRVRITVYVFVALMLEDVIMGIVPHDLFNVHDWESVFGCAMILAGLALRSWSAGILRKGSELTRRGPYAIMRNPLYVGSFLIMAGFCSLIDDEENIWFVLGPIACLYFLQVLHEERFLAQRFGTQWDEYARNVPRIFPRRWPRRADAAWEFQQWLGNREYNAFGATLLGMLAVEAWRLLVL